MGLEGDDFMNNITLIGRLTADPVLKNLEGGKKVSNINLAIQRPFKNHDGLYETDFIPITLWQGLAESLNQYCVKGTLIAVSGRVQMHSGFIQDTPIQSIQIIGERVSFLSSPKKDEEEAL